MGLAEAFGKVVSIAEKNSGKLAIGLGGATAGAILGAEASSPDIDIATEDTNVKKSNGNYGAIIVILLILFAVAFFFISKKRGD